MEETKKLLFTAKEVGKLVGLSGYQVRELARSGRFPAGIRLGHRTLRWRRSDVEDWIKNHK